MQAGSAALFTAVVPKPFPLGFELSPVKGFLCGVALNFPRCRSGVPSIFPLKKWKSPCGKSGETGTSTAFNLFFNRVLKNRLNKYFRSRAEYGWN
jgi:hypothetical protein